MGMEHRPDTRYTCAYVCPRNRAYMISWSETATTGGNATPDDLFDVASSLVNAKRIARRGAEELGWRGPFRWEISENGNWLLEGLNDDGYDAWVDDDGD